MAWGVAPILGGCHIIIIFLGGAAGLLERMPDDDFLQQGPPVSVGFCLGLPLKP